MLSIKNPFFFIASLAVGTISIATRVIMKPFKMTMVTPFPMPTQSGSFADANKFENRPLMTRQSTFELYIGQETMYDLSYFIVLF